ncbi:hypothetical protein [Paraburkholderia sp. BL10I2N1]|uniref:hypothetical protein n=1 Tax=Paraburkholderia sp. BL10I2N1 TaxID=1938796 RepID=UPI00105C985B|nr:hypothetical protein [Paraburkholderia sp. BL10I2N1]TDN59164.1 hypothetical protein B0G77_8362 [Paraburkholderia sp. BL10I2N1]
MTTISRNYSSNSICCADSSRDLNEDTPPPSRSTSPATRDDALVAGLQPLNRSVVAVAITSESELAAVIDEHIARMDKLHQDDNHGLALSKHSTNLYRYVKTLGKETRASISARLEEMFTGSENSHPVDPKRAVQFWLTVQDAGIRRHTPEQKAKLRDRQACDIVMGTMSVPLTPVYAMIDGIFAFVDEPRTGLWKWPYEAAKGIRNTRKDYNRDPKRPEYAEAFDRFMEVLADQNVHDAHKQTIVQDLVNHHLKTDKSLAPLDNDALVDAMNGPKKKPGHKVRHAPKKVGPYEYEAVIKLARDGYRSGNGAVESRLG